MSLNLVLSIFGYFVSICINFALTPFILKSLGDESFGLLMLVVSFANQIIFAVNAFNAVPTRLVASNYFLGEFEKAGEFYNKVVSFSVVIGLAAVLFSLAFGGVIASWLGAQEGVKTALQLTIILYAAQFALATLCSGIQTKIFVTSKLYLVSFLNICYYSCYATFIIIAFVFFTPQMHYVALSAALFQLAALLTLNLVAARLKVRLAFSRFDLHKSVKIVKSSLANAFNALPNLILHSFTLLFCNAFLGAAATAVLYLSKVIPLSLEMLSNSINASVGPRILQLYEAGETQKLVAFLRLCVKVCASLVGVVTVVFISVGARFFAYWLPFKTPSEIYEIYLLTLIFLTPIILFALSGILITLNTYTAKLRRPFVANLTMCVLVVISELVILLLGGGLMQLAVCASVFFTARLALFDIANAAVNLRLRFTTFYPTLFRACAVLLGLCGLFCWVENFFKQSGLFSLGLLCVCFGIFGLLSCFVLLLDKNEKNIALDKLRAIKARFTQEKR